MGRKAHSMRRSRRRTVSKRYRTRRRTIKRTRHSKKGGAVFTKNTDPFININMFEFTHEDRRFLKALGYNDKAIGLLQVTLREPGNEQYAKSMVEMLNTKEYMHRDRKLQLKEMIAEVMPTTGQRLRRWSSDTRDKIRKLSSDVRKVVTPENLKTGWEIATGQRVSGDEIRQADIDWTMEGLTREQKLERIAEKNAERKAEYQAKKHDRLRRLSSPFRAVKRALTPTRETREKLASPFRRLFGRQPQGSLIDSDEPSAQLLSDSEVDDVARYSGNMPIDDDYRQLLDDRFKNGDTMTVSDDDVNKIAHELGEMGGSRKLIRRRTRKSNKRTRKRTLNRSRKRSRRHSRKRSRRHSRSQKHSRKRSRSRRHSRSQKHSRKRSQKRK